MGSFHSKGRTSEKVKDSKALLKKVAKLKVGTTAKLKILRNGKTKFITVKVAKRDDAKVIAQKQPEAIKAKLGIQVGDLTPENTNRFNVSDTEGVIVTGLDEGAAQPYEIFNLDMEAAQPAEGGRLVVPRLSVSDALRKYG